MSGGSCLYPKNNNQATIAHANHLLVLTPWLEVAGAKTLQLSGRAAGGPAAECCSESVTVVFLHQVGNYRYNHHVSAPCPSPSKYNVSTELMITPLALSLHAGIH